ncbi:hypothetical protein LCGC14_1975940 [marine sediment metagenome]|uniref:Uncharacterized protein n=1 Tax=marine sediment metagenome TaxID=412755 RepID=A0A0F9FAE7_9ZZZZ
MKKLFCSQPKLLICIELKLAEILGVCGFAGIAYGLGWFITNIIGFSPKDSNVALLIVKGFCVGGGGLALIYLTGFGIYCAIKANWQWADRIKRGKK